jgi:hypothetical protein
MEIDPNKYYALRETVQFLPWDVSEPTFQKLIMDDINNNSGKKYNAKVLMRHKKRRYYIKGESIIQLIKEVQANKQNS